MGRRILGVALCLGLFAVLWNGVSCYSIPEPNCGFQCGDNYECPAEYFCAITLVCERIGASDHCFADAANVDAPNPAQPTVVSTIPSAGQTQVSRISPIAATFSEDVIGYDSSSFVVMAGPATVTGQFGYDPTTFTVTFTPALPMPPGALITVSLGSGITGTLGAPLAVYSWQFTTIDDVAPTLASSTPMDMDTNVPDSTTIVVVFSEPVLNVDTSSFTVAQGITPITGTITSGDNITFTFTPTAVLPSMLPITVSLGTPITDLAQNPLVPVSFSFTTM